MRAMRWRTWVGMTAVAMSVVTALPAQAAGPPGDTPSASQSEKEEAERLQVEIEQLQTQGRYEQALSLAERVLALREKALGPEHPEVARALSNLALLYKEKGDHGRAESLSVRALAVWEKALGQGHPNIANALNNLALLYLDKGDYGRAEPLLQRALAILEKALGPDHPHVARLLNKLATLYAAQGRPAEAVKAAQRAADIQDRNAGAVLTVGSEQQKRLYMRMLDGDPDATLARRMPSGPADPAATRLALTTLLRRKGRVLDAMADSLAELRRSSTPGDQAVLDRLASVYTQIATQVSRGPGQAALEQYRQSLAALEQERQQLEAELGRRSALSGAQQRLVTLSDVQAALPNGAALLEIARYQPFDRRVASDDRRRSAPRYVAYVVHREGEPGVVDLGEAAALEAAVDNLRRALGDPDSTHDPRPAARALDALLMQPLRKLLGDTSLVFLSPDGPLHLIPFGALVDEQGHYLVERYLFSYLMSGRDLLRFRGARAAARQPPLLLADPAFDASGAPSAPGVPEAAHRGVRSIGMDMKVPPVPSTREEARAIGQLFPDARVLLGAQATEGAVKAVRGPRLLHLATQGFYLPERPLPPAPLAGLGGEPTDAERAAIALREDPLLRSGVALAGFNRRQGGGDDDGVLTALEVAGLDLYGTQLVVLSTGESGLGEVVAGEGVVGMRRALSIAGAETQVTSLWPVDTGRTRELMIAYYRRLQAGGGRSEAMRQVQLAMLAKAETAHPNLWASFIVSGDWRSLAGEARLPELGRVSPGPRGCACGQAGDEGSADGAWVGLALGVVGLGRRRWSALARHGRTGAASPPRW